MIGFRDMTFCDFYKECKHGIGCERSLTEEVKKSAAKWWGDDKAPITVFGEHPECFISKGKVNDFNW